MSIKPSDIDIGYVATIILAGSSIIYAEDEQYWRAREECHSIEFTVVGLVFSETDRSDLSAFLVKDKIDYPHNETISHINQNRINSIKKNMIDYADCKQYIWENKNTIDNLLNKYGRWVSYEKIISAKKLRRDPANDSCKCRVCKNFIYMAAADSVGDGMMTCNSCISNPMRIYY